MAAKKKTSDGSGQRTRAPEATLGNAPEPEERVAHIIELMTDGQWVTGKTSGELAKEWGLAQKTVEGNAAEASRAIKRAFQQDAGDREAIRSRFLAKIEGTLSLALKAGRYEAARGILELEGKVCGHFEPEKVELSGNLGDLLQLGLEKIGPKADQEMEP